MNILIEYMNIYIFNFTTCSRRFFFFVILSVSTAENNEFNVSLFLWALNEDISVCRRA